MMYMRKPPLRIRVIIYIRGERVNDFRTLKKEMLFAINFSATQEIDRQLQAEKARNDALEARLLALEEKLNE